MELTALLLSAHSDCVLVFPHHGGLARLGRAAAGLVGRLVTVSRSADAVCELSAVAVSEVVC